MNSYPKTALGNGIRQIWTLTGIINKAVDKEYLHNQHQKSLREMHVKCGQ